MTARPRSLPADESPERLSQTEREVARLNWQGATLQEMADAVGVHRNTVKRYLDRIFQKTGVRRRIPLAVWYERHVAREE